jgi:hypothetical protein
MEPLSNITELQENRFENQVTESVERKNPMALSSVEQMLNLEIRLNEKFARLHIKILETKLELFQWICFFWVTQTAFNIAMILLLVKK